MAKLKTRKSVLKRFKLTKTGKVMRRRAGQDHNLKKQTPSRRRFLRKWERLSPAESRVVIKAMRG